jgi:hypothetical protein
MRFISKNANLRIILRPGLPANHLSGVLAVPTVFVRFQNGLAEVKDPDMIRQMKAHPGYNLDYICAEDDAPDPYLSTREENEPAHAISEIEYGRVSKVVGSAKKKRFPAEIEMMIKEQAKELAKSMLPEMLKSLVEAGAVKSIEEKSENIKKETNKSKNAAKKGGKTKKAVQEKPVETTLEEEPAVEEPSILEPVASETV